MTSLLPLFMLSTAAQAAEYLPVELKEVGVEERFGEKVETEAGFVDHNGRSVTLQDYLDGELPVLLTLNYYGCETLCSFQLNQLLTTLKDLSWTPGEQFRIVTVSIDHEEGPELAAAKRKTYLDELGRGDVDWSFLVGDEEQIRALADSVGFQYNYVPLEDQYAHPAVLNMLSPDGVISRYLYGLEYQAKDIQFALLEASDGKVGTPTERFVFSCFRYDTTGGKYTPFAFGIVRAGGVATCLFLGFFVVGNMFRERQQQSKEHTS